MPASDYSGRVAAAFDNDSVDAAVDDLKSVVADELKQVDRWARVNVTQYFNHSFSPDLVLSWPHIGVAAERPVYLRVDSNADILMDDIRIIGDRKAIVFEIDSLPAHAQSDAIEFGDVAEALSAVARRKQTLLTDAEGLETLIERRVDSPMVGLAAAAIVRGGRGLVDEESAEGFASDVDDGFVGARELEVEPTARAARAFERMMAPAHSGQLVRFLHAIWLGSGGRSDQFPTSVEVGGPLTDQGLEYLIEASEIDNQDFWRRIGRSLTTDQLGRLHVEGRSANLQHLVKANLDILTAKIARVLDDEPRLDADAFDIFWVIERGMLALRGIDFTAYLATVKDRMTVQGQESAGMRLQTLLDRAGRHGLIVGRLLLARDDRHLEYGSVSSDDVIHDDELQQLNEALGPAARVHEAVAAMRGGGELEFDFRTNTASGRTAAKFAVSDLLRTTLGLLRDLTVEELADLLPEPDSDQGQMSLGL